MPGYSGTPLPKNLGVKPGDCLVLLHAPAQFDAALGDLPGNARIGTRIVSEARLVMLFCKDRATLEKSLPAVAAKLAAEGAIWVCWPKKSSKLFADLTESAIRVICLPMGLVDVKVCAVTEDWSGLKLMVRKENRLTWNASQSK